MGGLGPILDELNDKMAALLNKALKLASIDYHVPTSAELNPPPGVTPDTSSATDAASCSVA
jgi:hypothetical protein